MRCRSCGATNPDSAQWCGQCLTRFDAPAPSPAVATTTAPAAGTDEQTVASGNFRRRGEEIEWACPSCGEFNSIDLQNCAVCGTGFVEQFRADEVEADHNWSQALLLSAAAPGAGHLAVGRYGQGSARLVLFLAWALGAVVLSGGGAPRAGLVVAPLALGALTLWSVTLLDVYRLGRGEAEVLTGRRLTWLVVAVLGLLIVGVFASVATSLG